MDEMFQVKVSNKQMRVLQQRDAISQLWQNWKQDQRMKVTMLEQLCIMQIAATVESRDNVEKLNLPKKLKKTIKDAMIMEDSLNVYT